MRRQRTDSVTGAVASAQASARRFEPPTNVPLAAGDMPFFHNVIDEFSRIELTLHQIELAAFLARLMADLEREQATLRAEGHVITRETGTQVVNPRARVVSSMGAEILAMRRSLRLHGDAPSRVAARRAQQKDAEIDHEDELLAKPN